MSTMEKFLDGMNTRFDIIEEKIVEFQDITVDTNKI